MTIKSFKALAIGILSGGIGGAISGALVVFFWMFGMILTGVLRGPWFSFEAVPGDSLALTLEVLSMFGVVFVYILFGAFYGVAGGMFAGLIGAVMVLTLFSVELAPQVGKWFGLLIGFGVTIWFAHPALSGAFRSVPYVMVIIAGAMAGAYGGRLAGRIGRWFIEDDERFLERLASTV